MKKIILLLIFIIALSCSHTNRPKFTQVQQSSTIHQLDKSKTVDLGNGWFKVTESVVIENITPEEAKDLAIQRACKNAIEVFSGVKIKSYSSIIIAESSKKILRDDFTQLINQTANGVIIEKEILDAKNVNIGNNLFKIVTLKVKVGKQKGKRDPYFNISAELNKEFFKEGENLEITVSSTKDCFLTIFNICSNDSVYILLPNRYKKDNFVKADEIFKLPGEYDKNIGLTFPVTLLPDKTEDTEQIKIIATKKSFKFSDFNNLSVYGTYHSAYKNLILQLISIPRDEVEEFDLTYNIYK